MADPSRRAAILPLFALALCALALCSLAGSTLATPDDLPRAPDLAEAIRSGVQLDAEGRVVYDPGIGRRAYTSEPDSAPPAPPLAGFSAPRWSPVTTTPGGLEIALEWHRAVFGTGIGSAGMAIADVDGDGSLEIVAGASPGGFGRNRFWYVLEPDGTGYSQRWTSLPYDVNLERLAVVQLDQDAALEVLIAAGGSLLVYDGQTLEIEAEHPTASGQVEGMAAAQLDGDPALEAAICDQDDAWVYDLATGVLELPLPGFGCRDLAVG
jgi:hypothetical protein